MMPLSFCLFPLYLLPSASRLRGADAITDDIHVSEINHTVAIDIVEDAVGVAPGRIGEHRVGDGDHTIIIIVTEQHLEVLREPTAAGQPVATGILQSICPTTLQQRHET